MPLPKFLLPWWEKVRACPESAEGMRGICASTFTPFALSLSKGSPRTALRILETPSNMPGMAETTDGRPGAATGLERARRLAEASGIAPSGPLLEAVAERLDVLLSELDSVTDEQLEGIEPATRFSADDETDGI